MRKIKTNKSVRKIVLSTFIITLIVSVALYGIVVYANWTSSAKKTTRLIATDITDSIYDQIYDFMQVPYKTNEINHKIIENEMLDISNDDQRNRFFVGIIESQNKEVYSFSYGTINGEYYGARRNTEGIAEINVCNEETGWHSWYYTVNEDKTAGEFAFDAGHFDPRTRAWYIAAVEKESPTYSPIYKHFIVDDLAVSAAWPVYNESQELKGVIGAHLLLTDIGQYLIDAVKDYQGIAIVIEKDSRALIANSLGVSNFTILSEGGFQRDTIEDIEDEDVQKAYQQYLENGDVQQVYIGNKDKFFINTKEINLEGVNWLVIAAVPESIFMKDVLNSMIWSVLVATLSLLLLIFIYIILMRRYLKPVKTLLNVSEEFSQGNLSKRIDIVRNDEIGLISQGFNNVADKLEALITNLDDTVKQRTAELEENKDALQLILDSAAEAIYGIDMKGNCTFCNLSCVKLLGYQTQDDLLGKNMHWQIHHHYKDGRVMAESECKIFQTMDTKEGAHADDEVFWKADGTAFDVEYFSYPQIKNGEIVGIVVTFMDISERKKKEAAIEYLSCYDTLTGFHNRSCFEKNRKNMEQPKNLPLAVIFADINGLKMTNDIFGHATGDKLIVESANILKQACRENDLIARIGGDEFIILLPKTTKETADIVLEKIKDEFKTAHIEAIKCSISLGCDVKENPEQSLDAVMANAENAMYKDKTLNRKTINKNIIDTIIDTLHKRNPKEKRHSKDVEDLCVKVGQAMRLPETEISKLKRAAYLHDIGKIVLDEKLLKKDYFTDEEREKIRLHAAVGYRILNLFDDTLDLAEYVYGHHERWDGSGYPRGLRKEQIPLISRIITAVETYDRVLHRGELSFETRKIEAKKIIAEGGGTQFDPQIVEVLIRIIDTESKGD
ncbi:MAG: diguanylate cyclase [Bacilli bacterium]|nr:diguanylate cyclase [Bacilli bacterium]